jgi:hypothetical protein
VQLIRLGLIRPWSYEEWQGLSEEFTDDVLDVFTIVHEVENAKSGNAQGNGTAKMPPMPDTPSDPIKDQLAELSKVDHG